MTSPIVESSSLLHLCLRADWQEADSRHTAIQHFPKLNVWRDLDLLPPTLQREVIGRPLGHTAQVHFAPGELVPAWDAAGLHRLAPRCMRTRTRRGAPVRPARGRFYPQGLVAEGVAEVFSDNMQPMRLVELEPSHIACDFNHPLAGQELALGVELLGLEAVGDEHGGRCTECVTELLSGPGMQMRYRGRATDFSLGDPFHRMDESLDGYFYSLPRLLQHLDRQALEQLTQLHGRLLEGRPRVLDLMASWDSHIPAGLELAALTGIGLNREELEANPRLTRRVLQDLNRMARLPCADASLDAVICSLSVEYLTRPLDLFREVARVLCPGGLFLISFSNRWFPTKAVAVWADLHEFERIGLVSEYFRQTEGFGGLHTLSLRGLPRPDDDRYAGASPWSDPLYGVWAYKTA